MCLLRTMLNAVRRLLQMSCHGFTIVLHRRAAVTILSLLMIVILLMCWTVAPLLCCRALITELTLIGGGEMTLSALLDLLMVAFGAAGMDGAVRNQAAATGTQTIPYIGQLLNRFLDIALDSTIPLPEWGKRVLDGLFTVANGTLYLDSDATAAIADFQRWAWSDSGANLEQFANIVSGDGNLTGGGYTAYVQDCSFGPLTYQSTDYYYATDWLYGTPNSASGDTAVALSGQIGRCYVIAQSVSGHSNTIRFMVYVPNTSISRVGWATASANGSVGMVFSKVTTGSWQQLTDIDKRYNTSYLPVQAAGTLPDISDMIGEDTVVGDVDTFVGPMQQGQGTQLPLGDVVTVSSDTAATMHLLNYLRAAAAAYAGNGTAQVPVTDVDTGEDELLPLSVPLDSPIGVTGVTDTAIDQSGAVAGTDAVAGDFAGTDDFTMDLTQFFPFCIPFDIYALYAKFEAEAEAPVIDWPIPIPGQEEPSTIHLDFSVFDSLAVWVRRLELIAFAVGLMFLTKHLIQGGD